MRAGRAFFKYTWLACRREQLWFPPAFLALFSVLAAILRHPAIQVTLARAYLGFIVPLIAGMLAAYAVLDDPALELRFSTPVRAGRILLERVGLILALQGACAAGFQLCLFALGVDLSALGGGRDVQLAWLVPTLALTALGTAGSLLGAQPVLGAFLVGAVWLLQTMMKSWFELNATYAYLFLGVLSPGHPALALNRGVLIAGSLLLWYLAARLLTDQERYL